nr:uncharacterized mitochondrial protein AtMg00810-like [Tanacetum cinerariifolium]
MVHPNNLGPDLNGKAVNETYYRGMIGSLMYLTISRPDIQFSTCLCARYQANPKKYHIIVVKRILRYVKGTLILGLWNLQCLGFDLKGYSDSDYVRCNMDRKSTLGILIAYHRSLGFCSLEGGLDLVTSLISVMEMEHDIENLMLNEYLDYKAEKERRYGGIFNPKVVQQEYNLYIARQKKILLNDHSYSFTPWFFTQPPNTPNTLVDKKDSDLDEILDDLFKIEAENLRRIGIEKVHNGCDDDTSRDTNHESGNLLNFPTFPATNEFSSICEHDVDLEKEVAQVEDDDGNTIDI